MSLYKQVTWEPLLSTRLTLCVLQADCLAHDGSALLKIINETYTAEQAIAIMPSLADAPAASGAQGLVASSAHRLVASSIVSVLVLLACVLM